MPARATLTLDSTCQNHCAAVLVPPARAPASSTARPCATRAQARARRHRIEAPWFALPLRPLTALDQEQKSGGTGGQARSRGGLGQVNVSTAFRVRKIEQGTIFVSREKDI